MLLVFELKTEFSILKMGGKCLGRAEMGSGPAQGDFPGGGGK
jgi:hypothetical protein